MVRCWLARHFHINSISRFNRCYHVSPTNYTKKVFRIVHFIFFATTQHIFSGKKSPVKQEIKLNWPYYTFVLE